MAGKRKVEFSADVTAQDLQTLETLERLAQEKRARTRTRKYEQARIKLLGDCPNPATLAQHLEPQYVITPAVELVSQKLRETLSAYSGRLVVAVPPQEMKSTLLRWLCFWALIENPERRIVFASYAASLARQSGRIVRAYTEIYGQDYGLQLDEAHRDAADWQLAGHIGGLFCTGVGGSLTGKPADCVVGSTRVTTVDGPVRVDELHRRSTKPLVASWDGSRVRWNRILASRDVGVRPVVEVVTRAGRAITCTNDHLVHTVDRGWVAAGELRPGERIHVGPSVSRMLRGVQALRLDSEASSTKPSILHGQMQEQAPVVGDIDLRGLRKRFRATPLRSREGQTQRLERVLLPEVVPAEDQRGARRGETDPAGSHPRVGGRPDHRRDSAYRDGAPPVLRRRPGADWGMSGLRQGRSATSADVSRLLSRGSRVDRSDPELHLLLGRDQANEGRARKAEAQGTSQLLLPRNVFRELLRRKECAKVRGVRDADAARERKAVLRRGLPEKGSQPKAQSERAEGTGGENLPTVRRAVSAEKSSHRLLRLSMCGRRSFGADDWQGQQSLQGWQQLRGVVQADAPADFRAGRVLSSVWGDSRPADNCVERAADREVATDRASRRRAATEQLSAESDLAVPRLPHDSPQVDVDTVAVVRRLCGRGERVYDIQVERDSNFFGNEVLVHNCLIIDDPTRNQADADSPTIRENLMEWWSAVARTRLAPGAPVIVVQTRWSVNDLAGHLIGEGWPSINIPAVADGVTEDALGREPGEYLESTRGRTVDDWQGIEREVGPRTWNALFMGRPVPLEGGVFKQAWFDDHRVDPGMEPWLREIVVGVDPAETGTGDEAGIIVAGLSLDGQLWILDDASGMYSQEAWGRAACLAWLRWGANRLVIERNLGMKGTIRASWGLLRRQAVAVVGYGVEGAAKILAEGGDFAAASIGQLREVAPYAEEIVDAAADGPREVRLTPKQSKIIRAESATQPFETGRGHLVGRFPKLEHQAVTFNASTSDSPDRVDCLALVVHHLSRGAGSSRILV